MSWRRRQTATYWSQVFLTIAALLLRPGWAAQPWVTEGRKPPVCKLILTLASCPQTNSNCNWNWLKPSVAPGYIIVSRTPASAVPPLIYSGASLDWRLSRGSIYNTCITFCLCVGVGTFIQRYVSVLYVFTITSTKVGCDTRSIF